MPDLCLNTALDVHISGAVITYNEARRIGECLDSLLHICDEVVVLDSFSTDETEAICRAKGPRVRFEQHPFDGHIEQKNRAMERCTHLWVLSLDGDEVLSAELIEQIRALRHRGPQAPAYAFNRRNRYAGRWLRFGGWYPDRKIRLWNRDHGRWGGDNPHDQVLMKPGARMARLDGDILHYTYETPEDHLRQVRNFALKSAKAQHQRGRRISALQSKLGPLSVWIRDYVFKAGFLDGRQGVQAARASALYQRLKYAELRRLQRDPSPKPTP
ncbi:glycosyltransferase [bacterium]|nr:glycosyltransferase [bacterium]